MSEQTLNPCPCGGEAVLHACDDPGLAYVACKKCPVQLGSDSRGWRKHSSAIAAWIEIFPLPKTEALPEKTAPAGT